MTNRTKVVEPTPEADSAGHPGACPVAWCPVCLAVSVMQPVAPDVVTHLLKAGTEMFLALQAIIETRAEDLDETARDEPVHLEKIDVG
jgi:hypothetical protein